jgi:WD40 repeat protein
VKDIEIIQNFNEDGYFWDIQISPDNTIVAIETIWDITTWDIESGKILDKNSKRDCVNPPDWYSYDYLTHDSSRLCDPITGENIEDLQVNRERTVHMSDWYQEKNWFITASMYDKDILVWDLTRSEEVLNIQFDKYIWVISEITETGLMAIGFSDGSVKILDVHTGNILNEFGGYDGQIKKLTWTPDRGYLLVAGGSDESISVLKASSWEMVANVGIGTGAPSFSDDFVAWSITDDINLMATGTTDQTIEIWEWTHDNWYLIQEYENAHSDGIGRLAWSPDGQLLASSDEKLLQETGTYHANIKIWSLTQDEPIAILYGHSTITALAWSPDGSLLASGSYDGTAKVWGITPDRND